MTIHILIDDIVTIVGECLFWNDTIHPALFVCRKWFYIFTPILYRYISIDECPLRVLQSLTDSLTSQKAFISYGPLVQLIQLQCSEITYQLLKKIIIACPNLKDLELNCEFGIDILEIFECIKNTNLCSLGLMNNPLITYFADFPCYNLERLNLMGQSCIDEDSIKLLFENCPNLCYIDLTGCMISSQTFSYILQCLSKLKGIYVERTDFSDNNLNELIQNCKDTIHCLNIFQSRVTDRGILNLYPISHKLEKLFIGEHMTNFGNYNKSLHWTPILNILSNCSRLTELQIRFTSFSTYENERNNIEIPTENFLPCLLKLGISGHHNDEHIISLILCNAPMLEFLELSNFETEKEWESVLKITKQFKRVVDIILDHNLYLKRIFLFTCDWVTNDVIKALCFQHSKICEIYVNKCYQITGRCIPYILETKKRWALYMNDLSEAKWAYKTYSKKHQLYLLNQNHIISTEPYLPDGNIYETIPNNAQKILRGLNRVDESHMAKITIPWKIDPYTLD
ncbi:hypothetical protein C1645_851960 [Glomus cerebriforme]|uniref:F-box domain-containing protein n=1 Tax=Glomus cerebriforme TaxID=658196 RepID=A0A397SW30_9GLOM|nr:hypothetical protein C1645_851960 [Glomus cerebriforme]